MSIDVKGHLALLFLPNKQFRRQVKNLTGFYPLRSSLYFQAFRHNSVAQTIGQTSVKNSNERLEFLGDAVLDLVVAQKVFNKYPFKEEGFLTEMRSRIVSREHLNHMAMEMGIDKLMDVQHGLRRKNIRTISGNALEALIGALYMDRGWRACSYMIQQKIIKPFVDFSSLPEINKNYKSILYHWCQTERKQLEFTCIREEEVNRQKRFVMAAEIDGKQIASGSHFSKKKAERIAAEVACEKLGISDINLY
jgi:ribonuclease-3